MPHWKKMEAVCIFVLKYLHFHILSALFTTGDVFKSRWKEERLHRLIFSVFLPLTSPLSPPGPSDITGGCGQSRKGNTSSSENHWPDHFKCGRVSCLSLSGRCDGRVMVGLVYHICTGLLQLYWFTGLCVLVRHELVSKNFETEIKVNITADVFHFI